MLAQITELIAAGELVYRTEPVPAEEPGENRILAKTLFSAISPGTEVAAFAGEPPLRPMKVYPRLVGYCNVAEVLRVGEGVADLRPGDRILTHQSHRSLFCCEVSQILATLDPGADAAASSTTYLFHLGYNALLRGSLQPGHRVAVLGLGTLGLTTVAAARAFGSQVIGLSNQEEARAAALEFGATACSAKEASAAEAMIGELAGSDGLDLLVTTSSSWEDWELALRLPRNGGVIAVLGFPGRGQGQPHFNPLASQYFYDRQLSLVACGYSPLTPAAPQDIRFTRQRNCRTLLEMIRTEQLPGRRLITEIVRWDQLAGVYQRMQERNTGPGTILLDWRDCDVA